MSSESRRYNRVYQLGDKVEGEVVVTTKGGLSHNGLVLSAVGQVTMQLSPNSVGLFDAFSNSLKPASLMSVSVELLKPGKLGDGASTIPFSFPLQPSSNNRWTSSPCPLLSHAIQRERHLTCIPCPAQAPPRHLPRGLHMHPVHPDSGHAQEWRVWAAGPGKHRIHRRSPGADSDPLALAAAPFPATRA